MKQKPRSIEDKITLIGNNWLASLGREFKMKGAPLNDEIDIALKKYFSKRGGLGGNLPDTKLILQDKDNNWYPILIEYKGHEDNLVALDANNYVENKNKNNESHLNNINDFAVNGAVHYSNALLQYTHYTDIIAIGMTGHEDGKGNTKHKIGVYYVSKSNFGVGQKIGEFEDFSFLSEDNFDNFITKVKQLTLSKEEIEKIKEQKEQEINLSLVKLNNDIYKNETGLSENARVYLVVASIISTIGNPVLDVSELKSNSEVEGFRDGDVVMKYIEAFVNNKKLPKDKKALIINTLKNILLDKNINKINDNGESQLKRVFTKIVDSLGIYYRIGLTTDFTGKLFNEMYGWLGFTQDKLNDVVLTPSYVSTLLVKLARVNRDSYVWDFATGSAGLLVAAMNEMLIDAKQNIHSPEKLIKKEIEIKSNQLLGLEIVPEVCMLAIVNMILMGDGNSHILNQDSIKEFNGNYDLYDNDNNKTTSKFPATAFILNPPYSAAGNGMSFVEVALEQMSGGYAAIIIQNSAGSGKAKEYNKRILEKHSLLASIKMPIDLFAGKASVQTNIYVFKVNEKHKKDSMVKFIDFSDDGYTRSSRKKSSKNLRDTNKAKERYSELVNLVEFGSSKLNIFTKEEYFEATIDPLNGADWNQKVSTNTKPTIEDFKKTVADYLSWEVSQLLKSEV